MGPHHSLHSLQAGSIAGGLLGLAATGSLAAYNEGRKAPWATLLSLAVSTAVTLGMGARYLETGKAYPGLYVAGPSAAMSLFYVWYLVAGPTPPKKKGGVAGRTRSSAKRR